MTKEDFHRWFINWAQTLRLGKDELFRLMTPAYQIFEEIKILSEAA